MRSCILLSLLTGCVAAGGPPDDPEGSTPRPLGVVGFDAQGQSPEVALGEREGASRALLAASAPDTCFALEGRDEARGGALDVLEEETATVRFQRIRCETGTPLRAEMEDALRLAVVARPSVPRVGRLSLRFVVTQHSTLGEDPEGVRLVMEALHRELDEASIVPELVGLVEVEGAVKEARFSGQESQDLEEMLSRAPRRPESTIDVVFAGCLRQLDPSGQTSVLEGYTGRVGGGGEGAADAVFLPSISCVGGAPLVRDAEATAHVLAHEIGHFLGLPHTEDERNTMHHNPQLATARGFTTAQNHRMRRHPYVR